MPFFHDLVIGDVNDQTKYFRFDVSQLTTGLPQGRLYTVPDNPGWIVVSDNEGSSGEILVSSGGLGTAPRWEPPEFNDSTIRITGSADSSRKLAFEVDGITSGTTRTLTVGDWSGTIAAPVGDGTATHVLTSNGAGVQPSWQAAPGASGGDSVTVNGAAVVDADFDDATPAAPAGSVNVKWQKDASSPANISAYITRTDIISAAWPVGSVFIAVVATNPATLLGFGTWSAFGTGRVLVGIDSGDTDFDVVEETGGSKTRTIAASNLPQLSVAITDPGHTHVQNEISGSTGNFSGSPMDTSAGGTGGSPNQAASSISTASATTGITATANTGGANNAISIVQPYIVVYMWKRTA